MGDESREPVEYARRWIGRIVEDDSTIPDAFYELYAVRNEIPGLEASLRSLMTELSTFGRGRPLLDIRDDVADIERPTSFVWGAEGCYWRPQLATRWRIGCRTRRFTNCPTTDIHLGENRATR